MSFPCTGCGSCCKRINEAVENIRIIDPNYRFPFNYSENGWCEMLDANNMCKVYDNRPELCNVDLMIEFLGLPKEEAYTETIKICNQLMDEDNVEQEKRIKNGSNL
jgi:hypothetical protein